MQNTRRHKRYKLDLVEVGGNMLLIDNVEILNMSFGGVSLKTDRALNIGKTYLITLAAKGESITVKGIVVRSALSGTEERSGDESAMLYSVSMKFAEGQTEKIANVLHAIEQDSKAETPVTADRRLSVRFHITMPLNAVLSHSAQFRVKKISLSGMLIQSDQALALNSIIPMGLSLTAEDRVNFRGRVASCNRTFDEGSAPYDVGVEFSGLTDKDRTLLAAFIDYLSSMDACAEG
jgi:hypothetical protein